MAVYFALNSRSVTGRPNPPRPVTLGRRKVYLMLSLFALINDPMKDGDNTPLTEAAAAR